MNQKIFWQPFFFLLTITTFFLPAQEPVFRQNKDSEIFLGILVLENNQTIPYFLKSIESLTYDKNLMQLQLTLCNGTQEIKDTIQEWIKKHQNSYKKIVLEDCSDTLIEKDKIGKNKIFGRIKNNFLSQCKEIAADYCFILSSEVFLLPHSLQYLIQKEKPLIAPLLRPVPEPNDCFRNFFCAVTPQGYYQDHPNYTPIANRQKLGTFKVPCIHSAYLIQKQAIDALSFTEHFKDWEFLAFSQSARENGIDQWICNEREFGFFLHFFKEMSEEEEKTFSLAGSDLDVPSSVVNSILSPYCQQDPSLKKHMENFKNDEYAVYRVQNKSLFYLDECNDFIKNHHLKQGADWEPHFHTLFAKYAKPGTIALDIGSHLGSHTLQLAQSVGNTGTVHAFEPQAKLFCELAINMYLNKCFNVVLHHRALGAENKWIDMHIPELKHAHGCGDGFINEGAACIVEASNNAAADRSLVVRLDDFQLNGVSFIKIDVEGYERNVIKGALETIKRNKPVMVVEIFQGPEFLNTVQEIKDLGYECSPLGGEDYLFLPKEDFKQVL